MVRDGMNDVVWRFETWGQDENIGRSYHLLMSILGVHLRSGDSPGPSTSAFDGDAGSSDWQQPRCDSGSTPNSYGIGSQEPAGICTLKLGETVLFVNSQYFSSPRDGFGLREARNRQRQPISSCFIFRSNETERQ